LLVFSLISTGSSALAQVQSTEKKEGVPQAYLDLLKPRVYVDYQLQTPFEVAEGQIALCHKYEGLFYCRHCNNDRLYFLTDTDRIEITSLKQLKGRVKILTPRDALAYVRITTAPGLYNAMAKIQEFKEAEVIRHARINDDLTYGVKCLASILTTFSNGHSGLVSDALAKQRKYPDAQCRPVEDGFEVRRLLVRKDFKKHKTIMVEIVERVGKDGDYERKSVVEKPLPEKEEGMWYFRAY
jgi:hypothetical protein